MEMLRHPIIFLFVLFSLRPRCGLNSTNYIHHCSHPRKKLIKKFYILKTDAIIKFLQKWMETNSQWDSDGHSSSRKDSWHLQYSTFSMHVYLLCVSYVKCLEGDFDGTLCNFNGGIALFVAWIRFWIVRWRYQTNWWRQNGAALICVEKLLAFNKPHKVKLL